MEITCTSQPKALPRNQISYILEGDPEYIGTLLFTRKHPLLEIERMWTDTQCEHVPLFASE